MKTRGKTQQPIGAIAPRLAALCLCLLFIWAAVGNGLDRYSYKHPKVAGRVPHSLAVQALERQGEDSLKAGDAATTLRIARALVLRAPIEPTSTALLGAATAISGKPDEADQIFRFAGQLGWRVPLTQIYWMQRAIAAEDFAIAGERLDAVLRQQPKQLGNRAVMDLMEKTPRGRAAMVVRLLNRPNWLRDYAMQTENVPLDILLLRAEVLMEVAKRGVQLPCADISYIVGDLTRLGSRVEAANLWHTHCTKTPLNGMYDGNFQRATLDKVISAFQWDFMGGSNVDLRLEPAQNGAKYLSISSSAPFAQLIAKQLMILPAGNYQLSWEAKDLGAQNAELGVAISCQEDMREWVKPQFDAKLGRWRADVTAKSGCTGQWLGLFVVPKGEVRSDAPPAQLLIGNVQITAR